MATKQGLADSIPEHGRDSQPTMLVSGETRTLLRSIPLQLLDERAQPGDGVVIVTAHEEPASIGRRLAGRVNAFEPDHVALVDCCTKQRSSLRRPTALRWDVPSPVSFSQASEALRQAFEGLAERGVPRTHVLCDTIVTQFHLAPADHVLQHSHDIAMTVGGERGLGVFICDASTVPDRQVERLKHLVDAHVEVRQAGGRSEVRWTGLVGRSDGWVPLADLPLDVLEIP